MDPLAEVEVEEPEVDEAELVEADEAEVDELDDEVCDDVDDEISDELDDEELAEAVELLRPFADESNEWISWVYDECNPVIGEQGDAERAMFTVGDLRKAAAFVAENGKVKS